MDIRFAPIKGSIPSIADIVVEVIHPDDPSTQKGGRTWNVPVRCEENNLAIFFRKPSDNVGGHFHPRCPNKDPEVFILLSGVMEFKFEDLYGEMCKHVLDARKSPLRLLIPPYIFHFVKVIEDALYVELQCEPFVPEVNYSHDEFVLLRSLI